MNKSDLRKIHGNPAVKMALGDTPVRNMRLLGTDGAYVDCADANVFSGMKNSPTQFLAYCDFQICSAFPNITGPTASGGYLGYHPQVLANSYGSLNHQWMNLRHSAKSLAAPDENVRDRMVGCVIATYFPNPPMQGWKIPETAEAAPFITARAVLWKLAEGMDRVLGQHMASRQDWSVSIEVSADWDNIGIFDPDTRAIYPLVDAPDELLSAVTVDKTSQRLLIGKKANGRQLAFAYGNTAGAVDFRGVGMTPNPAERTAKIISMNAEAGNIFTMAAEGVDDKILTGVTCCWPQIGGVRYSGKIQEVKREGSMRHPRYGYDMLCTAERPGVKIYTPDGQVVLKYLGDISLLN